MVPNSHEAQGTAARRAGPASPLQKGEELHSSPPREEAEGDLCSVDASPVQSVLAQSREYERARPGGGDSDEPRKSWTVGGCALEGGRTEEGGVRGEG